MWASSEMWASGGDDTFVATAVFLRFTKLKLGLTAELIENSLRIRPCQHIDILLPTGDAPAVEHGHPLRQFPVQFDVDRSGFPFKQLGMGHGCQSNNLWQSHAFCPQMLP